MAQKKDDIKCEECGSQWLRSYKGGNSGLYHCLSGSDCHVVEAVPVESEEETPEI